MVAADLGPLPLVVVAAVLVAGFIEADSVASLSVGLLALHSKSRRSSASLRGLKARVYNNGDG